MSDDLASKLYGAQSTQETRGGRPQDDDPDGFAAKMYDAASSRQCKPTAPSVAGTVESALYGGTTMLGSTAWASATYVARADGQISKAQSDKAEGGMLVLLADQGLGRDASEAIIRRTIGHRPPSAEAQEAMKPEALRMIHEQFPGRRDEILELYDQHMARHPQMKVFLEKVGRLYDPQVVRAIAVDIDRRERQSKIEKATAARQTAERKAGR